MYVVTWERPMIKIKKTYYPESAQIYLLDTDNLENDLELVYTTLEK